LHLPETLFLKLHNREPLEAGDRARLAGLLMRERKYALRQDIVPAGARATHSCLIVDGLAARYKLLSNGRRQFTAINVAGDFADLQSFLLNRIEYGVIALTPCTVFTIEHEALRRAVTEDPRLMRLLWMDTMIDASIHQEWIVSMGRRSAIARLAHLVCELFVRLKLIDRVQERSFRLPLTQSELADVLGLSIVHVNRVVSELRREGLIDWTNHLVSIRNWDRLREVAEFQPDYLSTRLLP
jgi:CRP-like cAMP-binding protein